MAREGTRKTRTPIDGDSRSRLRVDGKDAAYEYYIVNDIEGRVERMKEQDWEVVTDTNINIGDRRLSAPGQEGSAKTVSVGGGVTGVLMRIKREWWEADQAKKQTNATSLVNETLRDAKKNSDYGDVKIS